MTPERWQRVKSALDEALKVAPAARPVQLEQICGGDGELRREVESLLDFEENNADFFKENNFSSLMREVFSGASDAFIGRQIGHYKIVGAIGTGGMGAVYLAIRTDGEFEQKVAVKFLRQAFSSPAARQRFLRERQILASLRHPFIAQLIDGGTTDDGTPYLVMEYVAGTPLTRYAAENQISLERKLDLFRKICAAVSFAHENLIVHRDLKPDNILITDDEVPKLLDFGIAKLLSDTKTKATVTRRQALTPEYASPEQILGSDITTASDVYSLGIILYELLTGEHPYRRSGMTSEQICRVVTRSEPIRPSLAISPKSKVQSPKSVEIQNSKFKIQNPKSLKGDLDNIVLKALRREPERRYRSVGELSEDLKNYLRGFPVSARPDTFAYRTKKLLARNPLAAATILIAALSLIFGIIATTYQAHRANLEREHAERRFNEVRQLANSFMFEINEEIERSPVKARQLLVTHAVEYLDKLSEESAGNEDLESELAESYEKIGDVQSELFKPSSGKTADALVSHQKSLAIREKLFAAAPRDIGRGIAVARSRMLIGDILSMSGRIAEAGENYLAAITINENLLTADARNFEVRRGLYRTYARVGQTVLRSGSLGDARENYKRALAILQEMRTEKPDDVFLERGEAILDSYLGYVEMATGDYARAAAEMQKSLDIMRQIAAGDDDNQQTRGEIGTALLWSGVTLVDLGKTTEGINRLNMSLEMQKEIYLADKNNFGEQNALGDCFLEFGKVYLKINQPDAAIENLRQAVANYQTIWQNDRENISVRRQAANSNMFLAVALRQKGETAKARELFQQTLAEFVELVAADPNNIEWRHDLAFCHLHLGEMAANEKIEARAHFNTALNIYEKLISLSPENIENKTQLATVKKHLNQMN